MNEQSEASADVPGNVHARKVNVMRDERTSPVSSQYLIDRFFSDVKETGQKRDGHQTQGFDRDVKQSFPGKLSFQWGWRRMLERFGSLLSGTAVASDVLPIEVNPAIQVFDDLARAIADDSKAMKQRLNSVHDELQKKSRKSGA